MTAPEIVDQQLVIHQYFPLDGPAAAAAVDEVELMWAYCRQVFGMTDPIAGTGLSDHLPTGWADVSVPPGDESALAAQQHPVGGFQSLLRRHHDVVNLSVALAPGMAFAPGMASDADTDADTGAGAEAGTGTGEGGSTWLTLERRWRDVLRLTAAEAGSGTGTASDATTSAFGQDRLFVALLGSPEPTSTARLGRLLARALPVVETADSWWEQGVEIDPAFAVWELTPRRDSRAYRHLVVAAGSRHDADLSDWLWSDGGVAIPPLARYLLHTAKLRYQLRVWERDRSASMTGTSGTAAARRAVMLRMRRTVEIARSNMAAVVDGAPTTGAGPFADDRAMADWFTRQLGDDAAYQELQVHVDDSPARSPADDPPPRPADHDASRGVFVVHGRDGVVRDRMFDFLRSLDLRPLEWESLVAASGSAAPYLADVVGRAVRLAQAAVVLLTPDDEVSLHPSLRTPADSDAEFHRGMQARPNVLLELGMALATYPTRTVVIQVGELRPVADLGGLNFIRLDDGPECRRKIAVRLKEAGCPVDDRGSDWLAPGRFADLAAYRRRPGSR
ncbi:nucleotide-binding protein [Solwaraspora sp. WMMD406]|uniref:CATRA conflict system CASPASE/TPR repeat-associated protein n=1 Tax=Solwaraspora sp. WMMD406 TaxID=3016095 RepID=UPI0024165966|nr:CATRA conflict system CASPASE/TPR repeat-associated protein [Solwaraspora sp. WMMD406]MDG4765908.1 nucleotide-binding protein [Solwaraspora sp. WMMD406]